MTGHGRLRPLAAVAAVLFLLWGCERVAEGPPPPTQPERTSPVRPAYDPGELLGSTWTLRRLYGEPLVEGSSITLRFEPEAMGGYTGCNSYRGGMLQTDGGAFMTPGPEISLVPCTGERGAQQGRFLDALAGAARYRREGEELRVLDASDRTVLLFRRSGPEGGG